jgi:hypothetical protein
VTRSRIALGGVVVAAVIVALSLAVLYAAGPATSDLGTGQTDKFTIGTAIVVVGYLSFPILVLLGPALLLIAMMLLVGAAIERRRAGPAADD